MPRSILVPFRSLPTGSRVRGMTLVELMLAVMITALIGAATASMIAAVSYGTDSSRDLRSLVTRNKAVNARISAAIRGCKMVLDAGEDFMVLWVDDVDGDGLPSLLELRRIEFDADAGTLSSYRAPEGTTDVGYELDDNFAAITEALRGSSNFPQELWATDVADWSIALSDADPQRARLISYRIELASGDLTDTAIAAVSLRNAIAP